MATKAATKPQGEGDCPHCGERRPFIHSRKCGSGGTCIRSARLLHLRFQKPPKRARGFASLVVLLVVHHAACQKRKKRGTDRFARRVPAALLRPKFSAGA
jgi:hypothetical protein